MRLTTALLALLSTSACWSGPSDRAPQPVGFAPAEPGLFAGGGTLTDAWADYDGDGDPDRFVGFNGAPSRLYRNDGVDGFTDVAPDLGLAVSRPVRTSAWGDFDADGDPDLFLGFAGEAPVTALYRNEGAAGFIEVAAEAGLGLASGATRQASWVDYDGDGDLDFFLALRDQPNRLYRNDGRGGFADVTEASGIGDPRRTVGAVWFDADQDGDLDVVTANMNGDANGMWRNDGGAFTDIAAGTPLEGGGRGLGDETFGTVRPCVADVDHDGRFDVFFANYGPNALMHADASGDWTDISAAAGLAIDGRYDTCVWGDFDNDGGIDLFVNGTVTGGVQYRDYLLRREGSETFVDVTPAAVLGLAADHGATWVDFDGDGDLDLSLTGAGDDGTHQLLRNLLRPEFAWESLQVRVLDENGRATRAGAEVRVYAAGSNRLLATTLMDTGSGYDTQSALPSHIGLPGGQPVDVVVTFPAGGVRHSRRIDSVDPGAYRGHVLDVRIAIGG